jgi:hypothetical protein
MKIIFLNISKIYKEWPPMICTNQETTQLVQIEMKMVDEWNHGKTFTWFTMARTSKKEFLPIE